MITLADAVLAIKSDSRSKLLVEKTVTSGITMAEMAIQLTITNETDIRKTSLNFKLTMMLNSIKEIEQKNIHLL